MIGNSIAPKGLGNLGVKGVGTGTNATSKLDESISKEFRSELEKAKDIVAPPSAPLGSPAADAVSKLKFSSHAVERMQSRGISFAADKMKQIESAIDKAAAKGSKDTLVIAGDQALIVSVKNNTVVTVMDRQSMKENVFTNIDSTVVI